MRQKQPSACDTKFPKWLTQDADDWEEDFGPNHWRVVPYRALPANVAFCNGGFRVLNNTQ